jgi:hypothetical protein
MGIRHVKSDEARRHWRGILNEVERGGVVGVGRWQDEPTVWIVPDEWFQRAREALGEPGPDTPETPSERS